jgi:hypothetical protein
VNDVDILYVKRIELSESYEYRYRGFVDATSPTNIRGIPRGSRPRPRDAYVGLIDVGSPMNLN